jgi:hypothetical protein
VESTVIEDSLVVLVGMFTEVEVRSIIRDDLEGVFIVLWSVEDSSGLEEELFWCE